MSDINVQTFSGKVNITSNLLVGSSHLFVDTTNNRVGLITTTPDAGIHVNSNAYVHTDFRVGSEIVMNDTTGRITAGSFVGDGSAMTGINSDSGSWVNGTNSNVHLATSTDKVGIGTTDPEAQLHIGPKDNDHIYLASANNNYGWKIDTDDQGSGAVPFRIIKRTDDVDTTVLTIKNQDGNVGIGTSNPTSRLEVLGTNSAHNTTIYPLTVTTLSSSSTAVEEGIGTGIEFRVERQNTDNIQNHCGAIRVYGAAGIPSSSDYWNMAFRVRSNDTLNEPMTIKYNGNVGIGTTDPGRPLDVQFTGDTGIRAKNTGSTHASVYIDSASGYSYLRFQSSGAEKFWLQSTPTGDLAFRPSGSGHVMDIKNNGNVGIGGSDPLRKFHVVSGVGDTSTNWISGVFGGSGDYPRVVLGSLSTYACVGSHNSALNGWADLYLNNPTNPVVVKTTGKVGIGTSDPQSLLQVPRPAVAYDKVIQLGTQTTYADGDLYSLGFGGNALMGIGLATGTRSVFGRQGMATHIPNTETWGIYTNSWTKLINVDGSTRRVYFGHTDKFNLFYAPDNWSYSTASTSETNLWTFTVSIPQDGYLIVSSNGHWSNDTANKWVYAKIGVDSADPADTSGFYDSFTGGGASTNGGDFHGYKDSSVSWQDFNWSGTLKVSAGTRTICMRVKVSGGTFSLNGAAVNMLYIPKNYF